MKKIGVIVEYNPLHNGHMYHLSKIKETTNPDLIIAVCSSTFTMRGDLSMFDKFTKARQALTAGVDLVIELPAVYAVNNADIFAYHAIKSLVLAKVDEIWIGSERNDTALYEEYIKVENIDEFKILLKSHLKSGSSFKSSYDLTIKHFSLPLLDANDTLGVAYLKALHKLKSSIPLKTIKRIGSIENTNEILCQIYPSASAIRSAYSKEYVPTFVDEDYKNAYLSIEKLYPFFQYQLSIKNYDDYFFLEEGIQHHLKKYINENTYLDFITSSTSKRYSSSRIKRCLFYTLFQITKTEVELANKDEDFLRVLAANTKGIMHLNSIKKSVQIYTNIKEGINTTLDIELRITKFLDLVFKKNLFSLEQGFIKTE